MLAIFRFLFLALLLSRSLHAFALAKLALLTSLPLSESQEIAQYEELFRKRSEVYPFETIIQHQCTLYDLWNFLQHKEYRAIVWISHGNEGSKDQTHIGSPPLLVDQNGFDLSYALSNGTQSVRFLGVVACDSSRWVSKIREKFQLEKRFPHLRIQGLDGLLAALNGLETMLGELFLHLPSVQNIETSVPELTNPDSKVIPLRVIRTFERAKDHEKILHPAAVLRVQDQVLGIFPQAYDSQELQSLDVQLSIYPGLDGLFHLPNLVLDAGHASSLAQWWELDLGQLVFESTDSICFKIKKDSRGKILGKSLNIWEPVFAKF